MVAPETSEDVDSRVNIIRRRFAPDDLDGAWLAFACTDDGAVNDAVATAAESRGIWCVRADDAEASMAWVPASGAVDDVHVAITSGADPRRSRALRDEALQALHDGRWRARRTRRDSGRVVLVGGGPGDPGLLTMRGFRALLDADVVFADRLGPAELLDILPDDIEVIDAGKMPRGPGAAQVDINSMLVRRALDGQVVVRLKGGDPFVLGRGAEEVRACAVAGVPVEVIPGVSSVTASPTLAGVPLTRRGTTQSFTVASGHVPPGDPTSTVDWAALGSANDTLVLLMAVANIGPIAAALLEGGRAAATPAVLVENASLPVQRVVRTTLGDLERSVREEDVVPPAVIVIGDVVADPAVP